MSHLGVLLLVFCAACCCAEAVWKSAKTRVAKPLISKSFFDEDGNRDYEQHETGTDLRQPPRKQNGLNRKNHHEGVKKKSTLQHMALLARIPTRRGRPRIHHDQSNLRADLFAHHARKSTHGNSIHGNRTHGNCTHANSADLICCHGNSTHNNCTQNKNLTLVCCQEHTRHDNKTGKNSTHVICCFDNQIPWKPQP
ncbi:hypothetical protein BaRGS_00022012 [Batillaria attramentaria]|uniref:Secreted protein n=1 Tax=Batillaria attramentaria TaxID=370345 RepID=A0ABD0KHL5_9CAEN